MTATVPAPAQSIDRKIAEELGVRERQVTAAVGLLDGGATVPFIARYRKEATGTLDDAQLRTLEDLAPGMVLEGVVTNVAAFGAFVDIGVHQDGLVHVSAMSRNYVSDPREVVRSGDVVRVKVLGVDVARKRISLTLRLDDQPADRGRESRPPKAGPQPGPGRPAGSGRDKPPAGRGRDRGAQGGGGAMAEALRRAGLAGGDREDRRPR